MTVRTLLLICFACLVGITAGCVGPDAPGPTVNEPIEAVYLVRVPPFFDPSSTPGENHCRWSNWWDPRGNDADLDLRCRGAELPNDGVPLVISLRPDGALFINKSHPVGQLYDTSVVVSRLSELFRNREEMGVYRAGTDTIDKSIALDVPLETSYGDLIKLLDAMEKAGSNEMILYLDGHLPKEIYVTIEPR